MSLPTATLQTLCTERRVSELLWRAYAMPGNQQCPWARAALRANNEIRYWRRVVRNGAYSAAEWPYVDHGAAPG